MSDNVTFADSHVLDPLIRKYGWELLALVQFQLRSEILGSMFVFRDVTTHRVLGEICIGSGCHSIPAGQGVVDKCYPLMRDALVEKGIQVPTELYGYADVINGEFLYTYTIP